MNKNALSTRYRIPVDAADLNTFFQMMFGNLDIGSGWSVESDEENIRGIFHDDADNIISDPDVAVLSYDFVLDELVDEEREKFHTIFDHSLNTLGQLYDFKFDQDGSGNGLVYGSIALKLKRGGRKIDVNNLIQ